MTPRRYFTFGCLTILIQGGVLASQNTTAKLPENSGTAMGSNQAVRVSIAMQSHQRATIPKVATLTQEKSASAIKPKSEPKDAPKSDAVMKPKATTTQRVQPQIAQANKIKKVQPQERLPKQQESGFEVHDKPASHNQTQVNAKQGIRKQSLVLHRPTFATPPSQPHYPSKARQRGYQGTATVEVIFNQVGEQLSLTLIDSSGYQLLDKAALDAVQQWQFAAPAPQSAYAYTVRVPITFALN